MEPHLKNICDNHHAMLRDIKRKENRRVIGTLCSYAPAEILHSFGLLPVRLWGAADDPGSASSLLQSYICPPVRNLMAQGLSGRYDFLDGLVHSYTCDAACGLYNIWVKNLRPAFHHLISPPYMHTGESMEYYMREMELFIGKLEEFTGRTYSADRLKESIDLYDRGRAAVREIYFLKRDGVPVPSADLYHLNVAMQVLPMETVLPLAMDFLGMAGALKAEGSGKKRILLSGSVLFDAGIIGAIEERGGEVVADDTCLGYRLVRDSAGGEGDPLEALARFSLMRPPCSSRADFPARRDYILSLLSDFRVDGVIFVHQKFCDPHLSDYPFLRDALREEGVPQIQIEWDDEGLTARAGTRLDSFFEMTGDS